MKVLFIIPTLSSAYHQSRVTELSRLNVDCSVIGYERNYYPGKPWKIPVRSLGFLEHKKYLNRLWIFIKSIPVIRKSSRNKSAIICFNLDLLFICWIALIGIRRRPKIIYDVGDIRTALIEKGLFAVILRAIERFLLHRVSLLIVTSHAYITEYFNGILGIRDINYLIIENKLNSIDAPKPIIKKSINSINDKASYVIGYFGLIRCRKSLILLNDITQKSKGSIKVTIRGVFLGTEDLKDMIYQNPHMSYEGPYVSPDDLAEIHADVDFSWLVHAHSRANTMWARIFRFYHACYYKVPMIAQSNSKDSLEVLKYDIGFCIDINSPNESNRRILSIDKKDYMNWSESLQKLPPEIYLLTDEYQKLVDHIKEKRSF